MASNTDCKTCAHEKRHGKLDLASTSNSDLARIVGCSEGSIRRHRKHIAVTPAQSETSESSDGSKSVTAIRTRPVTLQDARDWISSTGDNPDNYTLSIRSIAYGADMFSNRMSAVPKRGHTEIVSNDVDPVDVLARLRQTPTNTQPFELIDGEESTFGLSINDIQLGQSYNGGSAATIEQFHTFVTLAQARILELRRIGRTLENLLIVVGGDLGEGCVIYGNQSFNLDLHRKQQNEGIIALLLHALDTLAPMFHKVHVLACKGNHGEHRINGKMTTLGDNDDTHAVEMAKLALSRDQGMQHITWTIAEDEAAVATTVHGWVIATTHGDVFAKGVSGVTTERKAHAWMKNMAAARKRFGLIADADVLITHHFHHEESKDWGDQLWKQTPSQDRGSPGFSQATGTYSAPGMLTWVTTPGARWKDEAVLR